MALMMMMMMMMMGSVGKFPFQHLFLDQCSRSDVTPRL